MEAVACTRGDGCRRDRLNRKSRQPPFEQIDEPGMVHISALGGSCWSKTLPVIKAQGGSGCVEAIVNVAASTRSAAMRRISSITATASSLLRNAGLTLAVTASVFSPDRRPGGGACA
jgi:hypothetical protein